MKIIILILFVFEAFALSPKTSPYQSLNFMQTNIKTKSKKRRSKPSKKKQQEKIFSYQQNKVKKIKKQQTPLIRKKSKSYLELTQEQISFIFHQCERAESSHTSIFLSLGFQFFSLYYALNYGSDLSFVNQLGLLTGCQLSYLLPHYCRSSLTLLFTLNRIITFPLPFLYSHLSHLLGYFFIKLFPHQLSQTMQDNIAGIIHSFVFYFLTYNLFFPELVSPVLKVDSSSSQPAVQNSSSVEFKYIPQHLNSLTQKRPLFFEGRLCPPSTLQTAYTPFLPCKEMKYNSSELNVIFLDVFHNNPELRSKATVVKTPHNRAIKMMFKYERFNPWGSPQGLSLKLNRHVPHLLPICDIYLSSYQNEPVTCLETPYIPFSLGEVFSVFDFYSFLRFNILPLVFSIDTLSSYPMDERLFNAYAQLSNLNQIGFVLKELAENNLCHADLHWDNLLTFDGHFYFAHDFDLLREFSCISDFSNLIFDTFSPLTNLASESHPALRNIGESLSKLSNYFVSRQAVPLKYGKEDFCLVDNFFLSLKEYLKLFPPIYFERWVQVLKEQTRASFPIVLKKTAVKLPSPPPTLPPPSSVQFFKPKYKLLSFKLSYPPCHMRLLTSRNQLQLPSFKTTYCA